MPYFLVVLNKVSQLFIVETIDFHDVPWLFFSKRPFVFSWVLIPLYLLAFFWVVCVLHCTTNTHFCDLWHLWCPHLLIHGVILYAFHDLHHFSTSHRDFILLQYGIVSPRLPATKEATSMCILPSSKRGSTSMQRFEHIFPFFSTHLFGVSLKVLARFSNFDYVGWTSRLNAFQGKVTINSTWRPYAPSTIPRHDLSREIALFSANQHLCWSFGTQSRPPPRRPTVSLSLPRVLSHEGFRCLGFHGLCGFPTWVGSLIFLGFFQG